MNSERRATSSEQREVVVIGASAAGLKAACRVRRLAPQAKVTVIEEGDYIAWAGCGLPYFLSGDIEEFEALVKTPYDTLKDAAYFATVKGVEVLTSLRANRLDPEIKTVICLDIKAKHERQFPYDDLVIATGAAPAIPVIAGIDLPGVLPFTRPEQAIELRRAVNANKINKVAVIGAGFIGCELCEAFQALWGIETHLFEIADQVLPALLDPEMARLVELELRRQKIHLHLKSAIRALQLPDGKLQVQLESGQFFEGFDRVVLAAGVKPRTELAAAAGVRIGVTGGIVVDERMQTSLDHVYAAGDCVELTHSLTGQPCYLPLGSLANRMGRVAANNIAGNDDILGHVIGASGLKVFDLNVAAVGLTARAAHQAGFDIGQSWGTFTDKAHYYPESKLFSAALIFDRQTQQVLGLQAAGKGEIHRQVDAASALIQSGASLRQMCHYEHAYAPPYATALDPLHFLAFAALAELEEGLKVSSPAVIEPEIKQDFVLDVREENEIREFPFTPKPLVYLALSLPELRANLDKIPRSGSILVVCQRGTRAAEAARILMQSGFEEVVYLGGGLGFSLP